MRAAAWLPCGIWLRSAAHCYLVLMNLPPQVETSRTQLLQFQRLLNTAKQMNEMHVAALQQVRAVRTRVFGVVVGGGAPPTVAVMVSC